MYVRKFEAETIDQALKAIKEELGPDAIILKTITNKGLKGAFKKNRIEITAAISEKNYSAKAQVDRILNEEQKKTFYSDRASNISETLEKMGQSRASSISKTYSNNYSNAYKGLALNRQVKQSGDVSLEDFLAEEVLQRDREAEVPKLSRERLNERPNERPLDESAQHASKLDSEVQLQKEKVDHLEAKLFELARQLEKRERNTPFGIESLCSYLRPLGISNYTIQELVKKATFELGQSELESADNVFELALREMLGRIKTEMPLFSDSGAGEDLTITVLIGADASGQTTMALKLCDLNEGSAVVKFNRIERERGFSEKFLKLDVKSAQTVAELMGSIRELEKDKRNIFIDYKTSQANSDETKSFIESLRRSFSRVEVIISISAVQSEAYSKNLIAKWREFADGINVSHLDLCLDFGALYNIAEGHPQLPYKFFGTGPTIPEDIEAASAERIIGSIFRLS